MSFSSFKKCVSSAALIAAAALSFAASSHAVEVAITIDDLPAHGNITPDMSRADLVRMMAATLKKHGVTDAYGMVNGKEIEVNPRGLGVLKEWVKAGFQVGNHTYSHLDLNKSTVAQYTADIQENEKILGQLGVNATAWHWFRYPFQAEGDTQDKRDQVRSWLATRGYKYAPVSVDFSDWSWNDPYVRCYLKGDDASIKSLQASYLAAAKTRFDYSVRISKLMYRRDVKQVLLIHAGVFDGWMLDALLTQLKASGATFVPLAVAAADPAYQINPDVFTADGLTFFEQVKQSRDIYDLPVPEIAALKTLDSICK